MVYSCTIFQTGNSALSCEDLRLYSLFAESISWRESVCVSGRSFFILLSLIGLEFSATSFLPATLPAFIGYSTSSGINFALGCANALLHSYSGERERARARIRPRWYFIQMVTVKSIDDFEGLIVSSAEVNELRAIHKRQRRPDVVVSAVEIGGAGPRPFRTHAEYIKPNLHRINHPPRIH